MAVWAGPHRKRRVQHALAQFFSFLYNVLYIMYMCVFYLPVFIKNVDEQMMADFLMNSSTFGSFRK